MIFGKKKPKEKTDTGWIKVFAWIPHPLFDGGYVWLQPVLKRTVTEFLSDEDYVIFCLETTKAQADEFVKEIMMIEDDSE